MAEAALAEKRDAQEAAIERAGRAPGRPRAGVRAPRGARARAPGGRAQAPGGGRRAAAAADVGARRGRRPPATTERRRPEHPDRVGARSAGSSARCRARWPSATPGAPSRSGGRAHKGVDMLSPMGTPTVAPVSGTVTHRGNSLGGLSWHLNGDDGNYYYGTHLSAYANQGAGHVEAGTVIGYVGDTGNARGTPHLHFEIHPGGGGGGQPVPLRRGRLLAPRRRARPLARVRCPLVGTDQLPSARCWRCSAPAAGAEIDGLRRLSGGASRETWAFDLVGPGTRQELILQRLRPGRVGEQQRRRRGDRGGAAARPRPQHGVPVARVVASDDGAVLGSAGHGGRAARRARPSPASCCATTSGRWRASRLGAQVGAALRGHPRHPRRRRSPGCSRPTSSRSTAPCSTGSASRTRPSSSASGGWRRTGRPTNAAVRRPRRPPDGEPARRPRRAARPCSTGSSPTSATRWRTSAGSACGRGASARRCRRAGWPPARTLVGGLRGGVGSHGRSRGAALVGGARHAQVGRHLHDAGVGPPQRGVAVGGAGHHRSAGVRERVGPARAAARRPARRADAPSAPDARRRPCTTGRRSPSSWRPCASGSTSDVRVGHRGSAVVPRPGGRQRARAWSSVSSRSEPGLTAAHVERLGAARLRRRPRAGRRASGPGDARRPGRRGAPRSWRPASTTSSWSPTPAGSTTTERLPA